MRLELTGRHIKITPALRTLVEHALTHTLKKLNSSAVSVQVVVTQEKTGLHAEATLHVKGERFLHAEATGRDARSALAAVLEKIDSQARKVKSKWSEGKRRAAVPERAEVAVAADEGVRIVRARRYLVKPMSADDAALEVGAAPNAFIVYRDATSEAIQVLFRRPDGHLGLIEPEA